MGAKAATTAVRDASSARFAAVLSTDQPPQLKPMIMVATTPTAAPWARCLTESHCKINKAAQYPVAHNGLVAGSSPAGPINLRSRSERKGPLGEGGLCAASFGCPRIMRAVMLIAG